MRQLLALAWVASTAGCASVEVTRRGGPPDASETRRAFVEHEMEVNGLPSVVVAIVDHENGIIGSVALGLADRIEHRAADLDTYYRIGSVTKVFTATALLALRDQGLLDLDNPVSKYIPEINEVVHPNGDRTAITIRHLVTHRSGLQRNTAHMETEQGLLAGLQGQALLFAPGTAEAYSNQGMALVGLVMSRAAHMPFRAVMQRFLLDPASLHCVWDAADVPKGRLAYGYPARSDETASGYIEHLGAEEPAGGLFCTARDLAAFATLYLRGPDDERALRAASREEALSAHVNWSCQRDEKLGRLCGHSGLTDEYSAGLLLLTDWHVGVVVLTNTQAVDAVNSLLVSMALREWDAVPEARLRTPEVPVFLDAARRHLEALVSAPVSAGLVRDHFVPEQLPSVGGAVAMAQILAGMRAQAGQCQVESVRAAGRTGQLSVVLDCTHARTRCTVVGQEQAPPHRIGLFSCVPANRALVR